MVGRLTCMSTLPNLLSNYQSNPKKTIKWTNATMDNIYLPHALEEDVGVEVINRTGEVLHG